MPQISLRVLSIALLVTACNAAYAENAMRAPRPSAVLSERKLERITEFFDKEVSGDKISGAIVLVQRHGKPVYFKSFGMIDTKAKTPMTPDAIFRIHSMSKPVTSFAAMMLIDDGKMKLGDPVSKYIPSFANIKVGVEQKSDSGNPVLELIPVARPVTVEDLLLHASGMTYGFYGKGLVRNSYANADLFADAIDNASLAEKVARLPLAEQPGTVWDYGHSTDVLGRVIEVVSGTSLFAFEQERLFGPLGMKDTSYFVADPAQHVRIAEPLPQDNDFRTGSARNPRVYTKWESGGGGLLTTIGDFSRFAQMILNGGTLDGKRYLTPKTFEAMTINRVAPASAIKRAEYYFPGDGFGFGLGFGVRTEAGNANPAPPGSLGELKWDGAGGTYFFIDRAQDMFAILMIQSPSERGRIHPALKAMIYDAFE